MNRCGGGGGFVGFFPVFLFLFSRADSRRLVSVCFTSSHLTECGKGGVSMVSKQSLLFHNVYFCTVQGFTARVEKKK